MAWETVAVAGISATAGVLGGYLAGRQQAKAVISQINADALRQQEEHAEDHLRHRQGVYNDCLTAIDRYRVFAQFPSMFKDASEWVENPIELQQALNAATLFGSTNVRTAVEEVCRLVYEAGIPRRGGGEIDLAGLDGWHEARGALVDAMRADTHRH